MTRIHLNGEGLAIPLEALPEGLIDSGTAPLLFNMPDGEDFVPADFIGLGFTHFEVYCIGAAGGQGGSETDVVARWSRTQTQQVMPLALWNEWADNQAALYEMGTSPEYRYIVNDPNNPGSHLFLTARELLEFNNPTHTVTVNAYNADGAQLADIMRIGSAFLGGAGGGGGLHRVSGELAALPAIVPVVVGQAGADAPPGQGIVNGEWHARPYTFHYPDTPRVAPYNTAAYAYTFFTERYPDVTFGPPEAGEDGGASSFGEVAKASGGKGGGPAFEWVGAVKSPTAFGGDGGSGGTLVAGGGGAGAEADGGGDGSWDGDIGKGGGGGRGGRAVRQHNPLLGGVGPATIQRQGGHGGQGSFSYGDTSVYGPRDFRDNFIQINKAVDPYTYEVIRETPIQTGWGIVPGGGGGAKAPGKRWHGSRALSFDPNGVVIIKVFKIE